MRVAFVGAGAIGSLFGGMLARIGVETVLIGRGEHINAIRRDGLRIESKEGSFVVKVEATANPLEVKKADIVFISVKAYDTKKATEDAKALLKKNTIVICLQNGLDTEREAAEVLGERRMRILRGITSEGAQLLEPGVVKHTGRGETIIGSPFGPLPLEAQEIVKLLIEAGFNTKLTSNVEGEVWGKVLVNAGINPIGAITGLRNGEIIEHPFLLETMRKIISEGEEVAKRHGIKFTEDPFTKAIKVAKMTADNKNSMLQDLERGKRTEIDYINGAIVNYGKIYRIDTPVNYVMMAMVKALEVKYFGKKA